MKCIYILYTYIYMYISVYVYMSNTFGSILHFNSLWKCSQPCVTLPLTTHIRFTFLACASEQKLALTVTHLSSIVRDGIFHLRGNI